MEPQAKYYDPEEKGPSPVDPIVKSPSVDLGDFVHLHCHSNLSFKDSINVIEEMSKWAVHQGQKALALTDHGHAFGATRHALAAKDAGIEPIFGMEAYEANIDDLVNGEDDTYPAHLTLLVMNRQGWINLCALHTKSYFKPYAQIGRGGRLYPRIDRKLLEEHNEGLICMSACLGGRVQRPFMNNESDRVLKDGMRWYNDVFQDRFFVELMANTEEQCAIIHRQRQISKQVGVKTVATNDVHYMTRQDGERNGPHNIYTAARYGNEALVDRSQELDANGRNQTGWYGSDGFYLKNTAEMLATGFTPQELLTSVEIASRCVGGFDPMIDIRGQVQLPKAPLDNVVDDVGMMLFESWRCSHSRVLMKNKD